MPWDRPVIRYRAKVYKTSEGWVCEVLEPDENGVYVRLTDYMILGTWQEAVEVAYFWAG